MIKLHNTLTRTVDDFAPKEEGAVTVYSCGPTVYDHITIGNLRAYIVADTINRSLKTNGLKVKHVMNITDVDDKTIKRSSLDYSEDSPEEALKKLTTFYELDFMDDIAKVGIDSHVYTFIRASESIKQMQELISFLIKEKFAYVADDGIYFSIENYKKSGKKYGQLLDLNTENTSKARINNDEYDKDSVHDFALWKLMKPGEPSWSFIIDGKDYEGRPGWHIECSAMSSSSLGLPIDIHTGGVDLIFPHHENEIAQSTAGKKDPVFAKYFVHNEHIKIEGKKISKSLGNGYTLKDLVAKGYDPLSYRLFSLQSHYRSQSDFNWDLLGAAQARLNKLRNFAALRFQAVEKNNTNQTLSYAEISDTIIAAINNDFNTPSLLAELSNVISQIESRTLAKSEITDFETLLKLLDDLLGLDLLSVQDIGGDSKKLLTAREEARSAKNWQRGDEIREKLLKVGISINDTDDGQVWSRIY
jgi:cysteinyl-tRNA synthetase